MTTVQRTAGAAGSLTLTTRNSSGQLVLPVSAPTVSWYTDAARTTGQANLTVAGSGSTYTVSWTGEQAPATTATRYLKTTIETSTGVFSVDADDSISFLSAGASVVSTDYTTLEAVKEDLGIGEDYTADDAAIRASISTASRWIDRWTGTTFYPVAETRVFSTFDPYSVWVDRFTSLSGLTVRSGHNGDYSTTYAPGDVIAWPYNAPTRGEAYQRIDVPGGSFAVDVRRPTVEVTASWGWDYVPDDVERAARLRAAALFRRRDSVEGESGNDNVGVVSVGNGLDVDVASLLLPFRDPGIA